MIGVVTVAMGCYRVPGNEACAIRCDFASNESCPNGLACGTDNRCHAGTQCDQLSDGGVDAPIVVDGKTCYGDHLVEFCPNVLQPTYVVLTGAPQAVDTDSAGAPCTVIQARGGVEVCVIAANAIDIQGILRARGRRPLVLFGLSSIVVTGLVDVSDGGAGTSTTTCASASGSQQPAMGGSAGGGAGGSFTSSGGLGGSAFTPIVNALPNQPSTLISAIRSGCNGGAGGAGYPGSNKGPGLRGIAGGAVYLLSPSSITITGSINASGGGGGGGGGGAIVNASAGGGGGGSGGFIGLEGNPVSLAPTTFLLAQGGGGGAGSSDTVAGAPGKTPALSAPFMAALGGVRLGSNGAGGAGSMASGGGAPGMSASGNNASGGGGGGGGGAIRFYVEPVPIPPGAVVSPLPI